MTTKKVLLVKYGEISLRKGNRGHAERELISIIKNRLIQYKGVLVKREQGRILIERENDSLETEEILPKIRHIFGIIGFCHAIKTTEKDINALKEIAEEFFVQNTQGTDTFKVETKRGDKNYPLTSYEVSREIGDVIFKRGYPVDLQKPKTTLFVEIRTSIYVYIESEKGEGGLPYGSSGRGVLLLSGGFDSPVAGYLAAKRGIDILPLYFHSPPFVSEKTLVKVMDIANKLASFAGNIKLHVVPFTDVQLFLKENVQEEKLTILTKRAMIRLASKYADTVKAGCLITGDSIGQVASQTIASLQAMTSASRYNILRPCAILDKQEIISIAKRIGTEGISKLPYDDCCTLFLAKHPEIKPKASIIERIEERLLPKLEPLICEALEKTKNYEI